MLVKQVNIYLDLKFRNKCSLKLGYHLCALVSFCRVIKCFVQKLNAIFL